MSQTKQIPELIMLISSWSMQHEVLVDTVAGVRQQLSMIRDAGFNSYCARPHLSGLKGLIQEFGFHYGGLFDADSACQFKELIGDCLQIGDGPVNCQLAHHDTARQEVIKLTIALMQEAQSQKARVHLEVHRDTCTETPEKTVAIIEGVRSKMGRDPLINFDFSHPAVVKHLLPEYAAYRPFFREGLALWLKGPHPTNKLWIVPELGTSVGYPLSCLPNIWQNTLALAQDIQGMWGELILEIQLSDQ